MTQGITEKKLLIRQQLETVVNEYNQVVQKKTDLFTKATELQGALKVLEELDYVPTDQPSNTEPTEVS
jgi:hypothetical protein